MGAREVDPAEFFGRKSPKRWDSKRFAARTPLSTVVGRNVRLERAPPGSKHWQRGFLLVVDVETGATLATIDPNSIRDPKTGWDLRLDC